MLVNSVKDFSYLTDMLYIGIESPENNGFKGAGKIVWQHETFSKTIINQLLRLIRELMSQGER